MAQSTKKTKSSSSRSGTRRKATGSSRNTGSKRSTSSTSRGSSSGSRRKGGSATQSRSRPPSRNSAGSITDTVVDTAKTTGRAATDAAAKAKTPLIAGGTALAGAAVGALIKSRRGAGNGKRSSLGQLLGAKPSKLDFDLDTVRAVATQMKDYGQHASDIADAVEKTLKKN